MMIGLCIVALGATRRWLPLVHSAMLHFALGTLAGRTNSQGQCHTDLFGKATY